MVLGEEMGYEMAEIVLKTDHLEKHFGSLAAVTDLNLEVYQGEIFGFLGPNGAGKTTSINMICGLLKPDGGQVFLNGRSVISGSAEVHRMIGVCPQNIVLWNKLTCLEQLIFMGAMYGVSRQVARQRGIELLSILGLEEKTNKLAATLSGGMQRRLNLIMALVHDPQILVLDEPEAGLDPQSRILVREYIRNWAGHEGRTVILTTHNMDEADRMADRVAIMDQGKLLVVDTPGSLKRRLGEGDVLEIDLLENNREARQCAVEDIRRMIPDASMPGNVLTARTVNLAAKLPAILDVIKSSGVQIGEIRLHENTLEDVFISLTGRRLRE